MHQSETMVQAHDSIDHYVCHKVETRLKDASKMCCPNDSPTVEEAGFALFDRSRLLWRYVIMYWYGRIQEFQREV